MANLSVSKAWDDTRAIFARDGRLFVAVALALVVLPGMLVGLANPQGASWAEAGTVATLLQMISMLIGIVGQIALIRLAIGPTTSVGGAIGHGFRRFPAAFGALLLLVLLIVLIGFPIFLLFAALGMIQMPTAGATPSAATAGVIFLLIILVFAISARFMLSMPVASAERAGPVAILKRSWRLSSSHYWRLIGFLLLLLLTALILMAAAGAIGGILARIISADLEPFSLGALVLALFASLAQGAFTLLSSLMLAQIYVQLAGDGAAEVSVPSSEH